MKPITMYLPQYHEVEENSVWWGKGFTDWVAVKNAKTMNPYHKQPKVPLHNNYYDLLNKGTMIYQSSLMEEYGIYGQCMYHYWFKNGKKILEKPAENLLKWKNVNMNYCFCWANESWVRSWSGLEGNPWADIYEKDRKNGSCILLEQDYGSEREWKDHFNYLLPFFRDERYIKKEGKPLFLIYKPDLIFCFAEMQEYWNDLAKGNGFNGIYFIGINTVQGDIFDAVLIHEPQNSLHKVEAINSRIGINEGAQIYDYDTVWRYCLEYTFDNKVTYYGGFSGFDDTPRRGSKGTMIAGANPLKFCNYLTELFAKNAQNNNEFVFINAWNEWGEGMYLEPDEEFGVSYLECIKYAHQHYANEEYKYFMPEKKETGVEISKEDKYKKLYQIFRKLLICCHEKKELEEFLKKKNYYHIAIYGGGVVGKEIINQLKNSEISIKYIIDKNVGIEIDGYKVINPTENMEIVDAVIVTVSQGELQVKQMLNEKKIATKIYLIEELLNDLLNE